jgi:hypothetical protein
MGDRTKPRTIGEVLEAMGLGRNGNAALGAEAVFAELRRLGVSEAQLDFQARDDECGVREIRFLRPGKNPEVVRPYPEYDERAGRWVRRDGYPEAMIKGLAEPIHAQYGGFEGELFVDGTISWRVPEGRVLETDYARRRTLELGEGEGAHTSPAAGVGESRPERS